MPIRIGPFGVSTPGVSTSAAPRQADFAGAVERVRASLPTLPIRSQTTTLIVQAVQYDLVQSPDRETSRNNWDQVRQALANELRETVKGKADESGKLNLKPEEQAKLQLINNWAAGTDRLSQASREALSDVDTEMRHEQLGKTIDQIQASLDKVKSTVSDHSLLHKGWDFVTGGGEGDDFENFLQGKLDKLQDLQRRDETSPLSEQAYSAEIQSVMGNFDAEYKSHADDFQDSEETWNTVDEVSRVVVATTVGIAATAISMNPALGFAAGASIGFAVGTSVGATMGAVIGTGATFLTYEALDGASDLGATLDGKDMYADGHSSLLSLGIDAFGGGGDGMGVSGEHIKATLKDTSIDAISSISTGGATAAGTKISTALIKKFGENPNLLQRGLATSVGGMGGQVINGTGQIGSDATRLAFDNKLFTAEGGNLLLKSLAREGINLGTAAISGFGAGMIPIHKAVPAAAAADDAVPAATVRTAAGTADDLADDAVDDLAGLADDATSAGTGTATVVDDVVTASANATGDAAATSTTAATGTGSSATTSAAGTADDATVGSTGATGGTPRGGSSGTGAPAPSVQRLSVPGLVAQLGNDLATNLGGAELTARITENRNMNTGEMIAAALGAVPGTAMNLAVRPKTPEAPSVRQGTMPASARATDPRSSLTLRDPLADPEATAAPRPGTTARGEAPGSPAAPAAARTAPGTDPDAPAVGPAQPRPGAGRAPEPNGRTAPLGAEDGPVPASREGPPAAARPGAGTPVEIRVTRLPDGGRAVTADGRTVGAHDLVIRHDRAAGSWQDAHIVLDVEEAGPHVAAFAQRLADAAGVDVLHAPAGRTGPDQPLQRVAPAAATTSARTVQVSDGRAFLLEGDGSPTEIDIAQHLGRRVDAGPGLTAFALYDKVVAFPRDAGDGPDVLPGTARAADGGAAPVRPADTADAAAAARSAGLPVLPAGQRAAVFERPAVIFDGDAVALRELVTPAGGRQVMLNDAGLNAASLASIRQIREVLAGRPVDPATGRPIPVERFSLVVMRDGRIALVDIADPRVSGRSNTSRFGVEMLDDLERGIRAKLAREAETGGRSLDAIDPVSREDGRRGQDPRRDQPEEEDGQDGGEVVPVDFRRSAQRTPAPPAELDMDQAAAPPIVGDGPGSAGSDPVRPGHAGTRLSPAEIEHNRQIATAIFERIAPQSLRMPEMTVADLVNQCARSPELMRLIEFADRHQVRLINAAHPDLAVLGHDQPFTIASYTRRLELISLDPAVLRGLLKDFPGGETLFIPEMTRNFAHELAHAEYRRSPPSPRDYAGEEAFTDAYVRAELTEEGNSRLTEYIVSDELARNDGLLPPRVARHSADRDVFARYKAGELTREEAARAMGELFRNQSRDVNGTTYGDTFAGHAAALWRRHQNLIADDLVPGRTADPETLEPIDDLNTPAMDRRRDQPADAAGDAAPQRYRLVNEGGRGWVIHNPDGSVRQPRATARPEADDGAPAAPLPDIPAARTPPEARPPAAPEPAPTGSDGPAPPRQSIRIGGRLGLDEPDPAAPPPPARGHDGPDPADAGTQRPRVAAPPPEIRFTVDQVLDGTHALDPSGQRVGVHESVLRGGLGDQLFAWRSPDTAAMLDVAAPGPHVEAYARSLATALGRDVTIRPRGGDGEPVTVSPGTPRQDGTVEFTEDGIVLTDAAGRRVLAPEEVPQHLGRVWVSQNAVAVQLHDQVVVLPHRPEDAPALIRQQQEGLDVLRRMGLDTLDATPATLLGRAGLASRRGTGFDQISTEIPVFDPAAGKAYSRFEVHDDTPLTAETIASAQRQRAAIERIIAEGPADPAIGRTVWVQDPDLVVMPDGAVRFRDPEAVTELPHAYGWERELRMLDAVEAAARAKLAGEDGQTQPPRTDDRIPVGQGDVALHGDADAGSLMAALRDGRLAADGDVYIYKFHNRWQEPDTAAPATLGTAQLRDWAHVPRGTGDALVSGRVRAGERWFRGEPGVSPQPVLVVSRTSPADVEAAGGFRNVDWAPRAGGEAASAAAAPQQPDLQFGHGVPPTREQQQAAEALLPGIQARLAEKAAQPKPKDLSAAYQDPDAPLPQTPASRIPPALRRPEPAPGEPPASPQVAIHPGFGLRLLARRLRLGLSQEQLADRAGLSSSAIGTYERGEAQPRPDSVQALLKALGAAPEELGVTLPDWSAHAGLGPRLVAARNGHGWSQARLAEESGVSKATIVKYENGGEPSRAQAQKLADALGIGLEDLGLRFPDWRTRDALGERVKALREESRLSQAELADRAGLSRSAVRDVETEARSGDGTVAKIAEALGVSETELRGPTDPETAAYWAEFLLRTAEDGPPPLRLQELRDGNDLVTGYEALLGRIGGRFPDQIVPYLERHGLMPAADRMIIDAVALQLAQHEAIPNIAVNVSAHSLNDPALPRTVQRICAEHGVDPRRLSIEVTETGALPDMAVALPALARLKAMGHRLKLDDFGQGHSLGWVEHAPPGLFDVYKIDMAYVRPIEIEPGQAGGPVHRRRLRLGAGKALLADPKLLDNLKLTVAGLHRNGIKVVAEGVETPELAEALRRIGVDELQGYGLHRPQPAGEIDVAGLAGRTAPATGPLPRMELAGAVPLPPHLDAQAREMGQRIAAQLAEKAARPKPRDLSAAHHDPDAPVPQPDPASRIPPALRGGQPADPVAAARGLIDQARALMDRTGASPADRAIVDTYAEYLASRGAADPHGVEQIRLDMSRLIAGWEGYRRSAAEEEARGGTAGEATAREALLQGPASRSQRAQLLKDIGDLMTGPDPAPDLTPTLAAADSATPRRQGFLIDRDPQKGPQAAVDLPPELLGHDVLPVALGGRRILAQDEQGGLIPEDVLAQDIATAPFIRPDGTRTTLEALAGDPAPLPRILLVVDETGAPAAGGLTPYAQSLVDALATRLNRDDVRVAAPDGPVDPIADIAIHHDFGDVVGPGEMAILHPDGSEARGALYEYAPRPPAQRSPSIEVRQADIAWNGQMLHGVPRGAFAVEVQVLDGRIIGDIYQPGGRDFNQTPEEFAATLRSRGDYREGQPVMLLAGNGMSIARPLAAALGAPVIATDGRLSGGPGLADERSWSRDIDRNPMPWTVVDPPRPVAEQATQSRPDAPAPGDDTTAPAIDPLRQRTEADIRRAAERAGTSRPTLPPLPPLDLGGAVPLPAHLQAQAEEMGARVAAQLAEEAAKPKPQSLSAAFNPPGPPAGPPKPAAGGSPPPPPPGLTDLKTKQGPPTGGDAKSLARLEAGIKEEFERTGSLEDQLQAEGLDGVYHPSGHWQEVAALSPELLGVMADAGAAARDTGRRDNATLEVQTTKMAAGNRGLFGNDIDHSGATVYTGMNVPKSRRAWPGRVVGQVADEFRALYAKDPEKAARVDPQIRFDPTDPKGAQTLRELTMRHPGTFAAVGAELMRGPLTTLLGRKGFRFQTDAQREALTATIRQAQDIGYPVFLRSNASEVKLGQDGRPQATVAAYDRQFDALKALLHEVGGADRPPVVVNDLCLDVYVRPDLTPVPLTLRNGTTIDVPRHVAKMEELLAAAPNVKLTMGEHTAHAIARSPELRAALAQLVRRHPGAVMFESGIPMPLNPGMYNRTATTMLPFVADLARIDPALGWHFIRGNYEAMIRKGRQQVADWTRTRLDPPGAKALDDVVAALQGHQAAAHRAARATYDSWTQGLPPAAIGAGAPVTTVRYPDPPAPTSLTAAEKHRVGAGTGWGSHTRKDVAAVTARVMATLGLAAGTAVTVATYVPSRILAVASGVATALRAIVGQRRTLTQQFNRLSWWRMTVDGQVGEENFAINVSRMADVGRAAGVDPADIRQVLWEAGQARADIAHLQHSPHLTDAQKTDAIKARVREFDHAVTRALGIGSFSLDPIDVRTARGRRFALADAGTNLVNLMSVAAAPFKGVIDAIANHAPSLFGRSGGIIQNVIGFFSGRRGANLVDRNTGLRIPLKLGGTWLTPAAAGTLGVRDGTAAVEAALRGSFGETALNGTRLVSDLLLTWFASRAAHNDSRVLLRFSRPIEIQKENLQLTVSGFALLAGGVAALTPVIALAFEDDDDRKQPSNPPSPGPTSPPAPTTSKAPPPSPPATTTTPPATSTAPPPPPPTATTPPLPSPTGRLPSRIPIPRTTPTGTPPTP